MPKDSQESFELRFIIGPGHAWLEVPLPLCERLGITDEISSYSYFREREDEENLLYLEEDCDAALFMRAAEQQGVEYEEVPTRKPGSYCRRLPSWKPD